MKKNIFSASIWALACLTAASCTQPVEKEEENKAATEVAPNGLKIAYVEVDSLMKKYEYCKDFTKEMEKKGENIRATLASKERALQAKAAEMQKKYESNQFTTKAELEQAQMQLAKQQQDLQALNERLMTSFNEEQAKFNTSMRDSIQSFLKQYNKTKKFDYVLSKAGDNILVANSKYDITNEVINGLNKRYKKKAASTTSTEKKEEVKK